MIIKSGGGYSVKSESSGRNLGGPYKSKAQALKRLRQVEYFKHQGGTKKSVRGSKPMENSEMKMGTRVLSTVKPAGKTDFNTAARGKRKKGRISKMQKRSVRGSGPMTFAEVQAGSKKQPVFQKATDYVIPPGTPTLIGKVKFKPGTLGSNLQTVAHEIRKRSMPKHSLVSQLKSAQNRRYS